MGRSESERYVAIITVKGTDIEEWYEFHDPLDKEAIKQTWLDDVRDSRELGERLAKQWRDNVEVEQLWKTRSGQPEKDRNPTPLEGAVEEEDDEQT